MKSESLREIILFWEKQIDAKEAISHYLLKITKYDSEKEIIIQKERVKLEQLEMCSKYCFRLYSVNKVGCKEFRQAICTETLAPTPDIVNLDDLKSGFMTNQEVSWSYSGSDKCFRTYQVEYWEKYTANRTNIVKAYEYNIELSHLKTNVIYVVRVRAEGLMKTLNNKIIGNYSREKQFYTGDTELELSYYNEIHLKSTKISKITWGIKEQMRGSIFEFFILVKNSSGNCQSLFHLTCESCDEPKNQVYLNEDQKKKRQNLLKCKPVDTKIFQSVDADFDYLMKFKDDDSQFSVEIYGTNLLGIHLLKSNSEKETQDCLNSASEVTV